MPRDRPPISRILSASAVGYGGQVPRTCHPKPPAKGDDYLSGTAITGGLWRSTRHVAVRLYVIYAILHRRGFTRQSGHPDQPCALTARFHPYLARDKYRARRYVSVALFTQSFDRVPGLVPDALARSGLLPVAVSDSPYASVEDFGVQVPNTLDTRYSGLACRSFSVGMVFGLS